MVLGMKSKHKKGTLIKVNYIVHVQQIRPWPPSEALRSIQTVLLQWENGSNNCGSFLSVAGDSNIVFNESFMLSSGLYQKSSGKLRKNYLEFSLYEPRKDKVKGQLLGTALVNLADHGRLEDTVIVEVPMNFKKIAGNMMQPALAISLEPVAKDSPNSSPGGGLLKEAMNYNDDDSEMASWTDDDTSSYSSRTTGSLSYDAASASASPSLNERNEYANTGFEQQNRNLWSSSTDASPDTWKSKTNSRVPRSKFSERSMSYIPKNSVNSAAIGSSPSSISFRDVNGMFSNIARSSLQEGPSIRHKASKSNQQIVEERFAPEFLSADHYKKIYAKSDAISADNEWKQEGFLINDAISSLSNGKEKNEQNSVLSKQLADETKKLKDKKLYRKLSEATSKVQVMSRSDSLIPDRKGPAIPPSGNNKATLKHAKSIQIHGLSEMHGAVKPQGLDIPNNSSNKGKLNVESETKQQKNHLSDSNEWRIRAEMLEDELREAAVMELSLYSIVAEHSSSTNKVHTPARRLSRFYTSVSKTGPQSKRASAARAAVSGLVLVSKACGNDVQRLTFWLSNSIMLRAIVTQTAAELPHSEGAETDDWEDIMTFIIALEKVESWLFLRIIESVWWQTFIPHMQPAAGKVRSRNKGSGTKKATGKRNGLGNNEYDNLSMELWKKAFKDACERLCPIRAAGHECGCLSALLIMVMEQLVNRLDVAMFNAILRESAEEMPTDPISDPISDAKVLPVPPGKSSFTAGAQLKNAIGNWSRWLTDLFGLEDDSAEDNGIIGDGSSSKAFKAFRLLHTLSDLMMIPFGILVDTSTRKEVCPTLGPTIIKRVLNNFVPDEFCPEPIPRSILNTLDSEEVKDQSGAVITSLPCVASPAKYSPPPAALLSCVGEVGSQVLKSSRLSTLNKSHASDDELDELESPLTSIIPDSHQRSSALARLSLMPKEKGGGSLFRYQLLKETWEDGEEE
ncbi:uncharacterized protein LOC127245404 [Andrographis paniculata]|uniref:uncharacterized protein LOC127245404 n=1 Tax=Andrographis paniculata TaxID=175694 RepID=UPI0021E865B0|nr:uncharacterized protein LOC127245404 [Andrographis paniculata]